ncbi:LPS export ABC transporter ATP-binding protein [Acinetobacter towneri]|uniref:Lipopolysaccharide export system ATP-binding protein LptB n=2 Tax=Moraxellaceae TaxID=468 RepID=A0A1E8E4S1_9GAMM|nr:LPS export ABC transporter ATP-binding protein [Acinetobacter towneri]
MDQMSATQDSIQRDPQTLCIKHLAKNYNKRWVVKDVSFQMKSGEIVGLLGPNGAGKTTSFYMVVGLVRMDKGEIHLDQLDLSDLAMHERARKGIGYLPQEASIFRKLTISENIMAILETRKDLNKQQRQQRLAELLADFKITHIKDSLGMSVSGGERRRAEIARALAADPKFMLLDEPFAGVDPISVGDIKDIIRTLKDRNIGVLITDHNVRETLAICERAYIVSEGSVIAEGTPQEILENEIVREVYLGEDFFV